MKNWRCTIGTALRFAINITAIISLVLLSSCQPATPRPTPIPTVPASVTARAEQRQKIYQDGIGSRIIVLGSTAQAPILATTGFPLANEWYTNQLTVSQLSSMIQNGGVLRLSPDSSPPLQMFYYLGDELFLNNGSNQNYSSEIIDEFAPGQTRRVCLNHPGQSAAGPCKNTQQVKYNGVSGDILSLEFDLYRDSSPRNTAQIIKNGVGRFEDRSASGTVVAAKKITIAGDIRTEGYNLVLVADDIEFIPGGMIDTTPPNRPAGPANSNPNFYNYEYKHDGYDAGSVVLIGRNIRGPVSIFAKGSPGQTGRPGEATSSLLDNGTLSSYTSAYYPVYKTPNGEYLDALKDFTDTLKGENYDLTKFGPKDPWNVRWTTALLDVGENDRGGNGGRGGLVTIFSGPGPTIDVNTSLAGGPAGNGGTATLVLPSFSCPPVQQYGSGLGTSWHRDSTITSGSLNVCSDSPVQAGWLAFFYHTCDLRICQLDNVRNNTSANNCANNTCPTLSCTAYAYELTSNNYMADSMQFMQSPICGDAFSYHLAELVHAGKLAPIGDPGMSLPVQGKPGIKGNDGKIAINKVKAKQNLEPLEDAGTNSSYAYRDTDTTPQGNEIDENIWTAAQLTFAPMYPDLMLAKADYLYRSLEDSDLLSNDAAYVADPSRNPFGVNRILLAQHFLISVGVICQSLAAGNTPAYCAVASSRLQALKSGLNWLGLPPELYLPKDPSLIRSYVDALDGVYEAHRNTFYTITVDNLDKSLSQQNLTAASLTNLSLVNNQVLGQNAEKYNELQSFSYKIRDSFSQIDSTNQALQVNQGPDLSTNNPSGGCPECGYTSGNMCSSPSINVEVALLSKCSEPPPCDFMCWLDRGWKALVALAEAVSAIYSFNPATLTLSLKGALDIIGSADGFLNGLKTLGTYAQMTFSGKSGTLYYNEGTDKVSTDGQLKKGIVDPAKDAYSAYQGLSSLYAQMTAQNPLQNDLKQIRDSVGSSKSVTQESLTDVYRIEAASASSPDVYAHAKSLEDLLKKQSALLDTLESSRQDNLWETYQLSLALSEYNIIQSEYAYDQSLYDSFNSQFANQSQVSTGYQKALEADLIATNSLELRMHYFRYLYQRSLDYMRLSPPSNYDFTRIGLFTSDNNAFALADTNSLISQFISTVLFPQQTADYVKTWISSAQFKFDPSDSAAVSYHTRTSRETELDLCGSTAPPCKFTPAGYWNGVVQALMKNGTATFEIVPLDNPDFLALSDADKASWNDHYMQLDPAYRMRVVDVEARLIYDDFREPLDSITPEMVISHDVWSSFRTSAGGPMVSYLFDSTLAYNSCLQLSHFLSSSVDCSPTLLNYEELRNDPFADVTHTASQTVLFSSNNISTISNPLFGSSVNGKWILDINPWLNQLRNVSYNTYATCPNGKPNCQCPPDKPQCTPLDSFWWLFRGIQFVVYFEKEHL